MGAQSSCETSAKNCAEQCAEQCVTQCRVVESVIHSAANDDFDHSKAMLHESLLNQELIRAAMEGRDQMAAWQLTRGAFIETRRPFSIVFEGDLEQKRSHANLGLTPLMHAALGGHVDTCAVLVAAGAQVDAEDEDRMRPMHFAAKAGSLEIFKLLLRARADANCKDVDGLTPLAQLAPWCTSAKADFEEAIATEGWSLLPSTAGSAGAAEAAPESQDVRLSDQEPTIAGVSAWPSVEALGIAGVPAWPSSEALGDGNAWTQSHDPGATLDVLDSESSDETAIPEGLLQDPNWMVREQTLLPADSVHAAGDAGAEANSLQDGSTEADELYNEGDIEISESMCQADIGESWAPLPL
mmetsp:Transcript_17869/g.34831  ORF Transcript_17869/g.34831 Transcript_17869/m.34831 type:complete len:355 (-) Transcript_17869:97-1161(-)